MKEKQNNKRTAIVGAGASGLVAAFYALQNSGNSVVIFEKNSIPGKKLRVTGNGKCNFSNADLEVRHFLHYDDSSKDKRLTGDFVTKILKQNGREEYFAFLERLGMLYLEKNGYYYPSIERAGEFCDIICKTLEKMGAEFRFGVNVKEIERTVEGKFILEGESFDALVLACGGKAAPGLGSEGGGYRLARGFGHTVSFTYPVLVPLTVSGDMLKPLAGVRVKARVTGIVSGEELATEKGEIMINEDSFSGIAVFQISRHLTRAIEEKKDVQLKFDFLPEIEEGEVETFVMKRRRILGKKRLPEFFEGLLQKKLLDYLIKRYESGNRWEPFEKTIPGPFEKTMTETFEKTMTEPFGKSKEGSERIQGKKETEDVLFLKYLKNCYFPVSGHGGYSNAQCTRGGVSLSQVKENLESALVPGLYFTGEILDVDGDCGGYNLQWAFSCGKTVGDQI